MWKKTKNKNKNWQWIERERVNREWEKNKVTKWCQMEENGRHGGILMMVNFVASEQMPVTSHLFNWQEQRNRIMAQTGLLVVIDTNTVVLHIHHTTSSPSPSPSSHTPHWKIEPLMLVTYSQYEQTEWTHTHRQMNLSVILALLDSTYDRCDQTADGSVCILCGGSVINNSHRHKTPIL